MWPIQQKTHSCKMKTTCISDVSHHTAWRFDTQSPFRYSQFCVKVGESYYYWNLSLILKYRICLLNIYWKSIRWLSGIDPVINVPYMWSISNARIGNSAILLCSCKDHYYCWLVERMIAFFRLDMAIAIIVSLSWVRYRSLTLFFFHSPLLDL